MSERYVSNPDKVAILGDRVSEERCKDPIREVRCSSTYLNDDGRWLRLTHQQTPLD